MDSSILLARLIGPYMIVIGASLMLNQKIFRQIMEDFPKNPSLVFVTGLLTFVAGLATVLFHNKYMGCGLARGNHDLWLASANQRHITCNAAGYSG